MNEHKERRKRWTCPCCKVEGWSRDGSVPADHDRADGRFCAAYANRFTAYERNNIAASKAFRPSWRFSKGR